MTVLVWLSFIMSVVALVGARLLLRAWSINNDEIMEIIKRLRELTEIAQLLNQRIDELQKAVEIIKRLRESVEIAQMLNQRIDELQKEVERDDGRG